MEDTRTQEQRLRRAASRQGLMLSKSRRRDPRALDFGVYYLIDVNLNALVTESDDLDHIEEFLTSER